MSRTLLIGIMCFVLGGSFGFAQRKYTVYGHGGNSCGDWTSHHTPQDQNAYLMNATWVVGFVSGVGYLQPLKRTDVAGIDAWIDAYCATHPLESVSTAAERLVAELSRGKE